MRRLIYFLLVFTLLCGVVAPPVPIATAAPDSPDAPDAPDDIPVSLVGTETTRYTLTEPKVFWYTGVPSCPPTVAAASTDQTGGDTYTELIRRIASYGSTVRTLAEQRTCSPGQGGI
ncbi:MAG: hypothetical protein R2932_49840 [Caldilineaceae bacterium]